MSAGAVEHLALPGHLQVALLDRGDGVIDDDKIGFVVGDEVAEFLDLAGAEQVFQVWGWQR